jgi:hypothetical protein
MIITNLLLQSGGTIGVVAAAAFFIIVAAVAFIAFKMLKRTVKMAFRIGIVLLILGIAVAGSIALWALNSGSSSAPASRPARNR